MVDPQTCPSGSEDPLGKVLEPNRFRNQPDRRTWVSITLRAASLGPVSDCPGDPSRDARCPPRDVELATRQALNVQEIGCVLQRSLGKRIDGALIQALRYETPYHLTSGKPVPIGVEFAVPLVWAEIESIAAHPFVERVSVRPGYLSFVGGVAAPAPVECPSATESLSGKVDGIEAIQSQGRQPVIVEMKDTGALPPNVMCPVTGDLCDDYINALWERTITNTLQRTCVNTWLDSTVLAVAPDVVYGSFDGSLTTTPLSPFGQPAGAVLAFGRGLTWDEARRIAQHPYVARVWTTAGLTYETGTCPADLSTAIRPSDCPTRQEPFEGKINLRDLMKFQSTPGPFSVLVGVAGGAGDCALPSCPGRACPERDAIIALWTQENLASQQCVRALIGSVRGQASPATFWLINSFEATLSWPQIQTVAAHPQVTAIEDNVPGAPPP
jgi:hypothetical protein